MKQKQIATYLIDSPFSLVHLTSNYPAGLSCEDKTNLASTMQDNNAGETLVGAQTLRSRTVAVMTKVNDQSLSRERDAV